MAKLQNIPTRDLTHGEWLSLRFKGLGGSDVAASMGLSKFKTPIDLWKVKVECRDDFKGNAATEWGTRLEDVVAQAYSDKTGHRIRKRHAIMINPDFPWLFANIDRLVIGEKKGLEVKTASLYTLGEWGDEGTDEVPDYYKTQAYTYMLVTGYRVWDFAVLIGGSDFRIYTVYFDQAIADRIIEETRHFWYENVQKAIPPEPVNLDDVRRIYRQDNGAEIESSDDVALALSSLAKLKERAKALKEEEEALKTEVAAFMGEHSVLTFNGKKAATFKTQTANRVDSRKLKTEFPDVYADCVTPSTSRVFRTY